MSDEFRNEGAPVDRLTALADILVERAEKDARFDGVQVIVCLDTEERGGLALHGYENDADALVSLLGHARAIMRVHGGDMNIGRLADEP